MQAGLPLPGANRGSEFSLVQHHATRQYRELFETERPAARATGRIRGRLSRAADRESVSPLLKAARRDARGSWFSASDLSEDARPLPLCRIFTLHGLPLQSSAADRKRVV